MPGLTSPQNFPYPLYTEPAGSGAAQIQALAEAVDDAIVAQQVAITNAVTRKRAAVSATTVQSIPNNAATNATFVTENLDNDNMASLGVDNAALTVQTAGLYLVSGEVNFILNAAGVRAATITLAGTAVGGIRTLTSPAVSGTQVNVSMLVFATVGQIIRLSVFQNSGGALDTNVRILSAARLSG